MELYVDTADLSEVEAAVRLGVLDGVTTNPTLVAAQRRSFEEIVRELDVAVDGRVWYEVLATEADAMVEEATAMKTWARRPVIKVPMGPEGIEATSRLSRSGIETNVTLVYSVPQALLAAKAGAAWVSPYAGRIDDLGLSGVGLIGDIVDAFAAQGFATKVLAASIRGSHHVAELAKRGVHGMTMPYEVLLGLTRHPATDAGLDRFLRDWEAADL